MDKPNEKREIGIREITIWILLFMIILVFMIPKGIMQRKSVTGAFLSTVRIASGNAPTFDFNLENSTINQSSQYLLDVNCSDIDTADSITYYDNFSGFDINSSTGLINKTSFNQTLVGNNSILITCGDGKFNTSQTFVLAILNVNDAPELSSIGSQILTEKSLFTLDVDATDPDNDTLTFSASTSLFNINSATGLINFTPTLSQVGNYTINISVFDGLLYDYEIVSFTIARAAFCGDTSCGDGESCSSCSGDCGSCPSGTPSETQAQESGGGESGGGDIAPALGSAKLPYYRCDEKWECSQWSYCSVDGIRTRKCIDVNKCNTKLKKPSELEKC